jgi:ABC-type proline/glycine betaine transport system ATPase subunit
LAYRSYVAGWCSAQSLLDTIWSHAEIESVTMGDRAETVRVTRSEIGIELISMRGERPLLVEIMGPAAAGKTSLVRALCSAIKVRAGLGSGGPGSPAPS